MTVTRVTLTMRDVMGLNGDPTVNVHRMLQDWGEGTSFFQGGQGTPATNGDATWLHTFFNSASPQSSPTWNTPGGDYDPTVSADSIVFDDLGGGQLFSWSGDGMVADAQGWLENPASNFGWILFGDESRGQSAKRFNSGESAMLPNVPPMLTIEYAFAGDYNDDGTVDAADYVVWRRYLSSSFELANETATPGQVTTEDFDAWKANFGAVEMQSGSGSSAVVPEPASVALLAGSLLSAVIVRRSRVRGRPGVM
jgi:hypothetical protein